MCIAANAYDQIAATIAQQVNELTSLEAKPDCGIYELLFVSEIACLFEQCQGIYAVLE